MEVIVGFCAEETKPFGPLQLYVAPGTAGVLSVMLSPVHTGELAVTAGAAGVVLMITLDVPIADAQPLTVMVRLYVPASAVVTEASVGFCAVEAKLLGPLQE